MAVVPEDDDDDDVSIMKLRPHVWEQILLVDR